MTPAQVASLLKSYGASDVFVARFVDNGITGEIIVDGLSDEDLKEMGFTSGIQLRGIKGILKIIVPGGWF